MTWGDLINLGWAFLLGMLVMAAFADHANRRKDSHD